MTDAAALAARMAALEGKIDRFGADVQTLLAESNEWKGVRKTLAVLGSLILGLGALIGVALTWFLHGKP